MSDIKNSEPEFNQNDVEIIKEETVFKGFFQVDRLQLKHKLYAGGWGDPVTREIFLRQPAVAVLPYDPVRHEILLVEQFRVGALEWRDSPWCLELIAGIADKEGEAFEQLVKREAQEEAGIAIDALVPITSYMPSPGGSNERLSVYLGKADLSEAGGIFGVEHEGEDIRAQVFCADRIPELLESGRLDNAASQVAMMWFMLNGEKWRQQWG